MYDDFEQEAVRLLMQHIHNEDIVVDRLEERHTMPWPDTFVPSKNVAVEVKQITRTEEIKRSDRWNSAVRIIKKKINALTWSGYFVVHGSFMNFHWKRDDERINSLVEKLHEIMTNPKSFPDGESYARFELLPSIWATVHKAEEEGKELEFTATSDFEYVDINVKDTEQPVHDAINKAIIQLTNFKTQNNTAAGWLLLIVQDYRLWTKGHILQEFVSKYANSLDQIWSVNHNRNNGDGGGWKRLK